MTSVNNAFRTSLHSFFEKYHTPLFLLLLFFSLFLRLYDLSETPLGMHADEVSGAYNAYSILKTGRDEHGNFFPLYFEAFNDYKHPFLLYSLVPSLALLDLTPFATRLPSVVFSFFGIVFFYFIIKKLFDQNVGLFAAFFLSFMPWYFHYSRLAFEVMSFCFLFLLGFLLFLRGFSNKRWCYISAVVFALSFYAYGIARLFVPLFLLGSIWIYRETLLHHKKDLLLCAFLFFLLVTPAYYASFLGHANARFDVVSIFARSETPFASFFLNYFSHFSPSYLFFEGDAQIVNAVTNWGELYHFSLFFLPFGLFYCWKKRREKSSQLLFLWLLLYPLAASLTYGDLPHSARSFIGVPVFSALLALGVIFFVQLLTKKVELSALSEKWKLQLQTCLLLLIVFFVILEMAFFFHSYFFVYKHTSADHFLAFAKPTVAYMEQIQPHYEHLYLSKTGLDLFYISVLYYTQADPATYQEYGLSGLGYEICDFEQCYNESQKNVYVFRGFEVTINGTHNIYYHTTDKIAVKFFETQ